MFYDLVLAKSNFLECLKKEKSILRKDDALNLSSKDLNNILDKLEDRNADNDFYNGTFELALSSIWSYYFSLNNEVLFYQMYQDLLGFKNTSKLKTDKRLFCFIRTICSCIGVIFNGNKKNKIHKIMGALEAVSLQKHKKQNRFLVVSDSVCNIVMSLGDIYDFILSSLDLLPCSGFLLFDFGDEYLVVTRYDLLINNNNLCDKIDKNHKNDKNKFIVFSADSIAGAAHLSEDNLFDWLSYYCNFKNINFKMLDIYLLTKKRDINLLSDNKVFGDLDISERLSNCKKNWNSDINISDKDNKIYIDQIKIWLDGFLKRNDYDRLVKLLDGFDIKLWEQSEFLLLHYLVENNILDKKLIQLFIDNNSNLLGVDNNGNNILHIILDKGRPDILSNFLPFINGHISLWQDKNSLGLNPIMFALNSKISSDQEKLICMCIDHKPLFEIIDSVLPDLIFDMIILGKINIIEKLIKAGIDLEQKHHNYGNIIDCAKSHGGPKVLSVFEKLGVKLKEDDATLIKKIQSFIKSKDIYSVYELSESGVSLRELSKDGCFFVRSIDSGSSDMVHLLQVLGCDPNMRDANGVSAYDHALMNNNLDLFNVLDGKYKPDDGWLNPPVNNNSNNNSNNNASNSDKNYISDNNPINNKSIDNQHKIIESKRWQSFRQSIELDNINKIAVMLSREVELLSFTDPKDDLNPFYIAVKHDHSGILGYLLSFIDKGFLQDNLEDLGLDDLLYFAISENSLNTVKYLVNKFPEYINKINEDFITPIFMAACFESFDALSLLIKGAENVGIYPLTNQPQLLHRVVSLRKLDLVRFLLDNSFGLSWRDINYNTPLHQAVKIRGLDRKFEIIELLCAYGSDINQVNKFGESSIDLALLSEDEKLIGFLKQDFSKKSRDLILKNKNTNKISWGDFKKKLNLFYKKAISTLSEEY